MARQAPLARRPGRATPDMPNGGGRQDAGDTFERFATKQNLARQDNNGSLISCSAESRMTMARKDSSLNLPAKLIARFALLRRTTSAASTTANEDWVAMAYRYFCPHGARQRVGTCNALLRRYRRQVVVEPNACAPIVPWPQVPQRRPRPSLDSSCYVRGAGAPGLELGTR